MFPGFIQIYYRKRGFNLKKLPLVSIIVLNYNGLQHLRVCLSSIFKTNYPRYDVIFVDNGSTDGSVDFVKANFADVQLIQNNYNAGVSKGFNLGIVSAKGKYVATLNNDIEVDPDWLLPLVCFMEKHSDVAAVDAKYLNYWDRRRFDISSAAGRHLDFMANPLTRGAYQKDRAQYDDASRVFYSCTLYRRYAIMAVGLFDDDFFYGYEDADLGWRLNLSGYGIMYVPSSIIYHKGEERLNQQLNLSHTELAFKPQVYFLNKRNKLLILIKNYSLTTLMRLLPLILFEHIGYTIYWAIKGNKKNSPESLQAILWALKNFRKVWTKHLHIQRLRKIKDSDILSMMKPYCGDSVKLIRHLFVKN